MASRCTARAALAVIEAADAAACFTQLPTLVLPALVELIGADSAGWSTLSHSGVRRYDGYPGPLLDAESAEFFERHRGDYPIVGHTRPGGPGFPLRRSDLQSTLDYHRTGLYAQLLRPLGVEHAMAMSLRHGAMHVCLSLHRSGRDFGPAALALLGQLRPLLATRAARLEARTTTQPQTQRSETPPWQPSAPGLLTLRQREVLALAGLGLTDTAIGHRLGCSPRTVDKHLEHVYRRLGVRGRTQAVAFLLTRER